MDSTRRKLFLVDRAKMVGSHSIDINFEQLVDMTKGMTKEQLIQMTNRAYSIAFIKNHKEITMADYCAAIQNNTCSVG
jgi:ATP-dependent Zn protease